MPLSGSTSATSGWSTAAASFPPASRSSSPAPRQRIAGRRSSARTILWTGSKPRPFSGSARSARRVRSGSSRPTPITPTAIAGAEPMAGVDEGLTFYPLRIAVLTVSDSRTEETDKSGGLLAERLAAAGHELAGKAIVPDDVDAIHAQVRAWADDGRVDVIVSTGGTGFAPRDVTPEAVKP